MDVVTTGSWWSSQNGCNWEDTLSYAENLSSSGYDDWRLPNAKELQGILDYARSPDTSI